MKDDEILKRADHPQRGNARGRQARNPPAPVEYLASGRREEPGDQIEQGGLAGSVRPDQGDDLLRGYGKVDGAHGGEPTEAPGEVARFEQGVLHAPLPSAGSASARAGPFMAPCRAEIRRRSSVPRTM